VKLRANSRANVRAGPGTNFPVSFSTDSGSALSGLSHLGEWIRVTSEAGEEGWIFGSLVSRRNRANP
jgi:SH3-like domain-containing protein